MNQKEELFYDKLKEIFIGEKVEGRSGFANLMRMKSVYFDGVFGELDEEIKGKTEEFLDFREELYNKLYTFLKKYFTDSGSILYRRTTPDSKIYEKVYDNEKDVSLFWKTNMLYYVKTEKIWKPLAIEDYEKEGKSYNVDFDISELEGKRGNVKKGIIFELGSSDEDKIVFKVKRSSHGSKTKTKDIRRELNKEGIPLDREDLEHLFKTYKKQNEVDFFINKDAERFLKEQFDLWIKHYVMDDETVFKENRLRKLKILRDIAYKIIDFVSQFEDELVQIWNKPKFVLNSNYVITLDKLAENEGGKEVIKAIYAHDNFEEQTEEWKELGILDEDKEINSLFDGGGLKKEYRLLPIDTKHFEDVKFDILSLFDNLDQKLDGWVIHSENYQALNTIFSKFQEEIKTIYIDPPYNTGSGGFLYRDRFQHSSWLTMLENRLSLSKSFLSDDGIIFISIGDTIRTSNRVTSKSKLISLMNEIFNESNYCTTLVRKSGTSPRQDAKHIANIHDYVVCYAKNFDSLKVNQEPIDLKNYRYEDEHLEERGKYQLNKLDRGSIHYSESLDYPIEAPDGTKIWPGGDPDDERWTWRWSEEKVEWGIKNDYIIFKKNDDEWAVYYKIYEKVDNEGRPIKRSNPYDTIITDAYNENGNREVENLFGHRIYEYPKPTSLINHLLKIGSFEDSIILDFFAGSGTTAESVIRLNKEDGGERKFILVEMADYFKTIIIPRLKKIAYSFSWKSGKARKSEGPGISFKYYSLEQSEQALKNCVYKPSEPFEQTEESAYDQYVFMKDEKMLDAVELDFEEEEEKIDFSNLYQGVDLAETLSNLKGKRIREVKENSVTFEDGEKLEYKDLDFEMIKPLIWW